MRPSKHVHVLSAFARRLNQALDAIGFPEKGNGRQVVLARKMVVSQKATRKWLEGEGLPDTNRIIQLADYLGTSVDWLLGRVEDRHSLSSTASQAVVSELLREIDRLREQALIVSKSAAKLQAPDQQ